MDYSLTFRFVTRTLSEDYRVYADGGARLLSDRSEFEPLRQRGGIVPEDGPCAILFEEDGRVFLVASGLRRPSRDVAGRPIRFSFCQIFGSGKREKERAMSAFERLTFGWADAESKVGELISEVPRGELGQNSLLGEDIKFDQEAFMRWLAERRFDADARPRPEWPEEGHVLRWKRNGGKFDYVENCFGDKRPAPSKRRFTLRLPTRESLKAMPFKKKLLAVFAIAATLALAYCVVEGTRLWNRFWTERAIRLEAEERAAEKSVREAREITRELDEKVSDLIEWIELRKASFDGRPEDIADLSRAADLIREAEKLLE